MKNWMILLLTAALLTACGQTATQAPATEAPAPAAEAPAPAPESPVPAEEARQPAESAPVQVEEPAEDEEPAPVRSDFTLEDVVEAADITKILETHDTFAYSMTGTDSSGEVVNENIVQYMKNDAGLCTCSEFTMDGSASYSERFIAEGFPGATGVIQEDTEIFVVFA